MDFLDIVDIFSNLSHLGNKEPKAKRSKIYLLFYVLLVPSIFWFAIEFRSILNLSSPFLLLSLSTVAGVILTFGTISLMYKLKLIEILKMRDFLSVLIPVTLLTISLVSFINRA